MSKETTMQFISNESENEFFEQALEGSIGLVNLVFSKFSPDVQRTLNGLIFSGAKCEVRLELCPHPTLVGLLVSHEQTIELFRIESPPEHHPETTH